MKKISRIKIVTAIYIAAFMLAFCLGNAQDFQRKIEWQSAPKSIYVIEGKAISQPTFANAAHQDHLGLLPIYAEVFPIPVSGDISVQLINPVFSPVQVDRTSLSFIKETIEPKGELSFLKKRPFAQISFLPFRKNPSTGAIEKLESFTLRMTVSPKSQRRAAHSYAANSGLATGTWYKIAVSADGIYKIDHDFIKNTMKIEPASFSFNTLAVFGNGGGMVPDLNSEARADDLIENPTRIVDNNGNNRMDEDDYLLFYGEMPDEWKFRSSDNSFYHIKNLYADRNIYFLTTDAGTGKRVSVAPSVSNPNKTIADFDEHFFHENDEVNLLKSGKTWFGDKMTGFSNSKTFSVSFPNLVTSVPIKFVSRVLTNAASSTNTVLQVNNQTVITHSIGAMGGGSYPPAGIANQQAANYSASSDQLNVSYTFNAGSDPSGTAASYIDYFEILCKRSLTLSGNSMNFRSISSVEAGGVSEFRLGNASSSTRVWDVTDIGNIQEMASTLSGSQLSFTTATDELKEFVAINMNGSFGAPDFIGGVNNQNLHAIGQPDMVIVTHDNFESASNELAAFHRSEDGLSVNVVKVSQIYNEFACGKPDISAIRDFMRMLYDRAGSDTSLMPRYLLLMGDGSYDPKDREPEKTNFISTYQSYESVNQLSSYTSDDFFGLLDANEGGDITNSAQKLDIGIGRLPVETETEAWVVVNKIKNYKKPVVDATCVQINSNGGWRNVLTFIADDLDDGGTVFETYSDDLATRTATQNPAYNYEKIYLDAYAQLSTAAGPRYPDVNTAILNRINSGTLVVNWVGHGGETNWAHERIFNMSDIIPLENKEKLPLFITATCEFSAYDSPERTAGEWLIVNGKGGGIASITTVRLVYQYANEQIANATFENLFKKYEGRDPRLGEVVLKAKNAVSGSAENTRKFTLLGDPALTLNYPRYDVVTTAVNNKPVTQDTIKALAQVTIKGEVRDDNGNKLNSFNGTVYPLVYDKISTAQTLANDPSQGGPITFKMYKNILFKGKASVTNGDFSFTFIVPKDINYQVGNGRISYYADNGNYVDAHGYTNDIFIGGASDSFMADGNGPTMDIYMNDEKFVYGGTTNSDPMLLLKLADETGINTVGNGIGHDLVAILDDNTQNRVVLNDYYESELDNFRKGEVKYPYTKLAEGRHTLKVKAWDIHNNSSEDYTEFVVASDARLALTHVYNYPNPFTTRTEFMFEHNRCCDDLNVSVQIYTVSGKLVKSIVEHVRSNGYRVDDIVWDGLDDYGDPIGKGVYVYKLAVRDSEGQAAHKFEKLVVLR